MSGLRPFSRTSRNRGSALLAALCFAAVFGISLASYQAFCYQTLSTSDRALQGARALNLAEAGLEQGLWSMNNSDWTGWSTASGVASRTTTGFSFQGGVTGQVEVTVNSYDGSAGNRTVTAEATITLQNGTTLSRTITIGDSTSKPLARAPVFTSAIAGLIYYSTSTGALSGGNVVLSSGGITIDSYNSASGAYHSTSNSGYSAVITSTAASGTGITISNGARVNGYVATPPTGAGAVSLAFGSTGMLKGPSTSGAVNIDTTRQSTNPYQTEFDITVPSGGTTISEPVGDYTFPSSGTYRASMSGGWYYISSGKLIVDGVDVVFVVPGNLYIQSIGQIVIRNGGSLQLLISGSSYIYYLGIDNQTLEPRRLAVIGTHGGTGTSMGLWSSTKFYGTIYAPNSTVNVWGYSANSEVFGAIAGNYVNIYPYSSTNLRIHYDLALRESTATFSQIGSPYVYPAGAWTEVTP